MQQQCVLEGSPSLRASSPSGRLKEPDRWILASMGTGEVIRVSHQRVKAFLPSSFSRARGRVFQLTHLVIFRPYSMGQFFFSWN